MIKSLIALTLACMLIGCASQQGYTVTVNPFAFDITDPELKQVEVYSMTGGAHLDIGPGHTNGFGLSKVSPVILFADGPAAAELANRSFLELLLDFDQNTDQTARYRKAFSLSPDTEVITIEKGDWLFIVYDTELGPLAYGASNSYELVIQVGHNDSVGALIELITNARLVEG